MLSRRGKRGGAAADGGEAEAEAVIEEAT
jgi:hypothetical protein